MSIWKMAAILAFCWGTVDAFAQSATHCVKLDMGKEYTWENKDKRFMTNTCDFPVHIVWCASHPKLPDYVHCGHKNRYFQQNVTLKPGERKFNYYTIPPDGEIDYHACKGGNSADLSSNVPDNRSLAARCKGDKPTVAEAFQQETEVFQQEAKVDKKEEHAHKKEQDSQDPQRATHCIKLDMGTEYTWEKKDRRFMTNTCDYPVTVAWCATHPKLPDFMDCGHKSRYFQMNSTMEPGERKFNYETVPPDGEINYHACKGRDSVDLTGNTLNDRSLAARCKDKK